MCTYIVETAAVAGSAKGADGWFAVDRATVAYDHPSHAPMEHALLLDFAAEGTRVGIELTLEGARELVRALAAVVERADEYEAR
jgi:uncharacterized protein DUF6295